MIKAYHLETKTEDEKFLKGDAVSCKAVVKETDVDTLKNDMRIVVLLSNGKKYMAKVNAFQYKVAKGSAEGTITIERFPLVVK